MSPATDLTAREAEIIRILRVLSDVGERFVVIGGYAVSALGPHRFSVDCDIATDAKHLPALEEALRREGYEEMRGRRFPKNVIMKEHVKTVGRDRASVEIYVNSVVSRTTLGTWSYRFIRENSVDSIVLGVTDSTPSRVVDRSLLVAMKLHASRAQDLGDAVVLSEGVVWERVAACAACGLKDKLVEQLDSAAREVSSPKFSSDLKSTFAMRGDVASTIERAKRGLARLKILLAEKTFTSSL